MQPSHWSTDSEASSYWSGYHLYPVSRTVLTKIRTQFRNVHPGDRGACDNEDLNHERRDAESSHREWSHCRSCCSGRSQRRPDRGMEQRGGEGELESWTTKRRSPLLVHQLTDDASGEMENGRCLLVLLTSNPHPPQRLLRHNGLIRLLTANDKFF